MAGIYIHIPFCKHACNYCNFHFTTSLKQIDDLVDAICVEIVQRKEAWQNEIFETIYFGGGTPSLLTENHLTKILTVIHKNYTITLKELTLECNPDDVNKVNLKNWYQLGINRLSMGVQSFFDEDLQWMQRSHTSKQTFNALDLIQISDIKLLTIDLIYGTPTLSNQNWLFNLDQIKKYNIPHFSAYNLTVEENTMLHKSIQQNRTAMPSEDLAIEHFNTLQNFIENTAYEQYETSNFSLPNYEAMHNSNYWKGIAYIGLGPSAHSYHSNKRSTNIANNNIYIRNINNNVSFSEIGRASCRERV